MSLEKPLQLEKNDEFQRFREILTDFQKSTGLTALLMDMEGNSVTEASHQRLCREFHQKNPEAKECCRFSNKKMVRLITDKSSQTSYRQTCANGLINVAVPIMAGERKVATLILGEFFLEPPNQERFRQQAKKFGFDEENYLKSLQEVPVLSIMELNQHLSFLQMLTEYFAEMIQGTQDRQSVRAELSAVNQQREVSIQQLRATEQELQEHYKQLKRQESQIKSSKERWSFAIEGSQDGVWDWDLTEGKNTITEQWAGMLGYTKEEIENSIDFFADHIHPEDHQRIHKILQQFRNGEYLFHRYEFRMRKKDGSYCWILSRGKVVAWDENGQPLRITGTHTDISGWREKMNRLIENRRQLTFVLEGSGSGIWEWDLENKTIYLDAGSRRILGLSDEIITTEEWNERIDPSVRSEVLKSDEETIREEKNYQKEILMRRKDGGSFWARISGRPVRWNDNGKLQQFSGIITDISEEKELEKAMSYQEQILSSFFQQSPDAIVHMTKDMIIKNVNRKFADTFEYTAKECRGQRIDDLIVAPHQLEEAKRIERLAGRLQNLEVETLRYSKHGKEIPVIIRGGPIMVDGKIAGHQATYTDISGQKRIEEQLKRALTETVNSFAKLSEKRDLYIFGHQQRVAQLAVAIGRKMNMHESQIQGLWIAAALHDIGKIIIPSEILSKPSRLTPLEFEFIKTHPQNAYDVLADIDFDWPVADMILQHHEKIDGSGYPNGLKREEILLGAKILMVSDVVEAISSHRPQRPALGLDYALKEIEVYRGYWYDEAVADACLSLFREDGFQLEAENPNI